MRPSISPKELLLVLFMVTIFFPLFNGVLFYYGIYPFYTIMERQTEIFYDGKMLMLSSLFIAFFFLHFNFIILTVTQKIPFIKETDFIKKVAALMMKLCIIFLIISFAIAPILSIFISGYVYSHYHPCSDNTGIFTAATYVKNGTLCSK